MTFQQMLSDLRSRIGDVAPDKYTDIELKSWLNLGQQDVACRLDNISSVWFGKTGDISLVSGTQDYDLPADVRKIMRVTINNVQAQAVDVTKLGALETNVNHTPSAAQPFYHQWGKQISVFPTPTAAGTAKLWYFKRLSDLTADADISEIPVEYHALIVLYAQILAMQKVDKPTAALEQSYERAFQIIRQGWTDALSIKMAGEKAVTLTQ
ncbi:MAG: hypothetical protein HPY52_11070 [Firmicutes bacterium]|nr:hypothetical protein [Bacillota bacterium]